MFLSIMTEGKLVVSWERDKQKGLLKGMRGNFWGDGYAHYLGYW